MTSKTPSTFDKFHAMQTNQAQPKTGQYVPTQGHCFNAATTDIIRTQPRTVSR